MGRMTDAPASASRAWLSFPDAPDLPVLPELAAAGRGRAHAFSGDRSAERLTGIHDAVLAAR